MRKFVSAAPALVVLLTVALTLFAAPAAVRQIMSAQTTARVELAQQRLDADDILERVNNAVHDIAEAVTPSVVHIEAFEQGAIREFSSGAGWVYDADGHIITNAHVVRGGHRLRVQFHDGHLEDATFVGLDPFTDVAVIRVGDSVGVVPARRATSVPVRSGERVYAFGSPFGFKFSISEGIVSGLGREAWGVTGPAGYTNFIQTDAAVNPGNSGGPLVDVNGRVIGMNTAIVTSDNPSARTDVKNQSAGIGFAIPLETIESVAAQLIENGVVLRGYLGIGLTDVQTTAGGPDGFRGSGVLVQRVEPGQPAARAGLREGDVITHLDGERTPSVAVLRSRISAKRPGKSVSATVWRDGEVMDLPVVIGAAELIGRGDVRPVDPDAPLARRPDEKESALEASADRLARFGLAAIAPVEGGLAVTMVNEGSPAFDAGFRAGQIITAVSDRRVSEAEDLFEALAHTDGRNIPVGILDADGQPRLLSIRIPD